MIEIRDLIIAFFILLYGQFNAQVELYSFDNVTNYNSWSYVSNMTPVNFSYDAPNQRINYNINSTSVPFQTSNQLISRPLITPVGYQFIASFKLNRQISATNSYFPILFTPTILNGVHLHPWRLNPPSGGVIGGQQSNGLLGVIITHNGIGVIHRANGATNGATGMISAYSLPINQDLWIRLERICATSVKLEVYSNAAMTNLLAGQTFNVSNPGSSLDGLYIANCNGNGTTTKINDDLDDYRIENTTTSLPTFTAVGPFCVGDNISALPTTSLNGITGTWSPTINNTSTTTYTFTPTNSQCFNQTTMTILINNTNSTPTFNITSNICSGATLSPLPTTSLNGITGTWLPAINNTTTTNYTFTPNSGQCALDTIINIAVTPLIIPTFNDCSGSTLSSLPTNSNEGIVGIWSTNNNGIPNNYTFIPASNQCAATVDKTFFDSPNSSFSTGNVCDGETVAFTNATTLSTGSVLNTFWDFGDGSTSANQNPTHDYSNTGVYNVMLITESDLFCRDTALVQLEVYPNPIANFQFNNACEGQSILFSDLSIVSGGTNSFINQWNWDFGPTISGSLIQEPTILPVNSDTIITTLTVTTNNGCESNIIQDVIINPSPVVSFSSSPSSGCSGICIQFESTSSIASDSLNTLEWDFGNGIVSNEANPYVCFQNNVDATQSLDVQLTATSSKGCSSSFLASNYVILQGNVQAIFDYSFSDNTINFINESINAENSSWTFDDLGSSTEFSPSFTFPNFSQDTLLICLHIVSRSGCEDSICMEVAYEEEFNYYISNAFTPNNDGKNDVFVPVLFSFSENEFEFLIFDRWGTLVYESHDVYNTKWNGTYKNEVVQEDVYVWKLKGESKNDRKNFVNITGFVTVIR